MPGASKYNWTDLKTRYFAGEWESTRQMATALKAPFGSIDGYVRKHGWYKQRKAERERAEEEARRRVFKSIMQGAEKRAKLWLEDSEIMRGAARKVLKPTGKGKSKVPAMTVTEAIRALKTAGIIDMEVFLGKGLKASTTLSVGDGDEDNAQEERSPEELRNELHSKLSRIVDVKAAGEVPSKPKS